MARQIEVSDELFDRIQKAATPFVDLTPSSVLTRWADYYESGHRSLPNVLTATSGDSFTSEKTFNPQTPPDLQHTRVRGTFDSAPFSNWNDLVRIAHIRTFAATKSVEEFRKTTHAQIRLGDQKGENGYHFVPDIGLSIQGLDANRSWSYSLRLAHYCQVAIAARVEWRHTEKAAFPGETASLFWAPK